ncbi:hypothetical protein AFGD_012605 [Aspergillus flavus]|nr:hypothetical protein AFGD_012605 [Aspergillus flavus]
MTWQLKTASCLRSDSRRKGEISKFLQKGDTAPTDIPFSQQGWEETILSFLSLNRLPFTLIEHPTFIRLIKMARSAPSCPSVPSAITIHRRLKTLVQDRQQGILRMLPPESKISIALDCWTSPFSQAFMAITGYLLTQTGYIERFFLDLSRSVGHIRIQDRVFGLTTDNASNNKTLVDSLQQVLSEDLLDCLNAIPLNETAETKWTDRQSSAAKANARQQKYQISSTLKQVRFLAVYINASPQRREAFNNLQPDGPKLVPIQDVLTRWNPTFLMLRRAKRLRPIFTPFCAAYDCEEMLLSDEEWRQIDYLLYITEPFFLYTTELSKTRDMTSHLVFKIYNVLFDHLEKSISQLQRKRVPWKIQMLEALKAGRRKLDEFYSETDGARGHLYAIRTMLSPDNKFQFFLTDDWDKKWRDIYRNSFQEALAPYQQRLAGAQGSSSPHTTARPSSGLSRLLKGYKQQAQPVRDEITLYLDSGMFIDLRSVSLAEPLLDIIDMEPLPFWRDNQTRFPAIASLARDILSVPATGAGVERLFNTARDLCHYRRGQMKSETVEELMMFLCTPRFDLEQQEMQYLQEYFTRDEIETRREERDEKLGHIELDEISETEEQDMERDEEQDRDDSEPQLPEINPQQRVSGRKRKIREDDGFQHY